MAFGGNLGGMGKMMKKIQQMQEQMEELQSELEERTVEGTAGGGVVRVVCNGAQRVERIDIDSDAVDPDDVEMLQDLVQVAVNDALNQSQDMVQEEMTKITGGLNLPGGMPGLPGLPG